MHPRKASQCPFCAQTHPASSHAWFQDLHADLHRYGNFLYLISALHTNTFPGVTTRIKGNTAGSYWNDLCYMMDAYVRTRMGLPTRQKAKHKFDHLFNFLVAMDHDAVRGPFQNMSHMFASKALRDALALLRCEKEKRGGIKPATMMFVLSKNQQKKYVFDSGNRMKAVLKKFALFHGADMPKEWEEATRHPHFFFDTKPLQLVKNKTGLSLAQADLSKNNGCRKRKATEAGPVKRKAKRPRRPPVLDLLPLDAEPMGDIETMHLVNLFTTFD